MSTVLKKPTAAHAPTRFVEVGSHRLAYRMIGDGPPLLLCLRLRGVMDGWDPAFLDALAQHFTVITFDYSGLGQSTGTPSYAHTALARDARDVADALGLDKVVIGGWSLGGIAAQVFTALYPARTSHAILIGTGPPGAQPQQSEPIFLPTVLKPHNTLEDEYVLFFEPASAASRAAGQASHARLAWRTSDCSPPIPEETSVRLLRESHDASAIFPDHGGYAAFLASTAIPLLAICGDHDIVFPVENWYALNRQWKSLHIITFPQSGHGPQQQLPEVCADVIASFVRNVR